MDAEIVTRTCRLCMAADGISRSVILCGAHETRSDAESNVRALGRLHGGTRRPNLVDVRQARSVNREARAFYAGPQTTDLISAAAILVGSPLSRAIGTFMSLHGSSVPTRLFTSEEEALAWLREFLS